MLRYVEQDDRQALSALYENCGQDLYFFLLKLSDSEQARDISQKTWLKVIEKRHLYRHKGKFKAWLFSVGRNLMLDEFKRHQPQALQKDVVDSRSQSMQVESLRQAFSDALSQLPLEQKEAFCLQQEGFSLGEIAAITGHKIETVKSRIRYAKNSLKSQLGQYHD